MKRKEKEEQIEDLNTMHTTRVGELHRRIITNFVGKERRLSDFSFLFGDGGNCHQIVP